MPQYYMVLPESVTPVEIYELSSSLPNVEYQGVVNPSKYLTPDGKQVVVLYTHDDKMSPTERMQFKSAFPKTTVRPPPGVPRQIIDIDICES